MARFRGSVQGGRHATSRVGHATTGIETNTNGWNLGVRVTGKAKKAGDEFTILITGGSNKSSMQIGQITVREHNGGISITEISPCLLTMGQLVQVKVDGEPAQAALSAPAAEAVLTVESDKITV